MPRYNPGVPAQRNRRNRRGVISGRPLGTDWADRRRLRGPQPRVHGRRRRARRYPEPMARPALDDLLHAAVPGVGGVERPGQVEMAHAVAHAIDARRAPARAGRHGHGQVARLPRPRGDARLRRPASLPSSRRPPWPCRPRSSTATCRGWPSRSPRSSDGRRPMRSSRDGATTCASTSSRAASPTTRRAASTSAQVDAGGGAARPGGRATARVGRRAPSPATATSSCPASPSAPGARSRCGPTSAWAASAPSSRECFVERAREAAKESTSSSPTTPSWRSTPSRAARCCPSTTSSSSTRPTSSSTGSPRRSPTSSPARWSWPRPRRPAGWPRTTAALEEAGELPAAVLEPLDEGRMLGVPDSLGLALARVRDTARTGAERPQAADRGVEADGARQVARAAIDEVHENA